MNVNKNPTQKEPSQNIHTAAQKCHKQQQGAVDDTRARKYRSITICDRPFRAEKIVDAGSCTPRILMNGHCRNHATAINLCYRHITYFNKYYSFAFTLYHFIRHKIHLAISTTSSFGLGCIIRCNLLPNFSHKNT